jgi:regulator of sigma E protease
VLHELGHFAAAKAVGMRVERFALFFPPLARPDQAGRDRVRDRDDPPRRLREDHRHEPGGRDPAGTGAPGVLPPARVEAGRRDRGGPGGEHRARVPDPLVAYLVNGTNTPTKQLERIERNSPAAGALLPGDRLVAVDGVRGSQDVLAQQISSHECPARRNGCPASTPARVTVERNGQPRTFELTPVYDAERQRTRLGFGFAIRHEDAGVVRAAGLSVETMWRFTTATVSTIAQILNPEKRKEISGVVGSYETTRQAIEFSTTQALFLLGVISLSLGVINLFPFLPLDGGHIFWASAEKLRGPAIPFESWSAPDSSASSS